MTRKNNSSTNNKIYPHLSLAAKLTQEEKEYLQKLYNDLPPVGKNQLTITGATLNTEHPHHFIVTAFIRSTLKKPVTLPSTTIQLLDKNSQVLAEKKEQFRGFSPLEPNQAVPLMIEFPKSNLEMINPESFTDWSLAFSNNLRHQVDFSDFDMRKVTDTMIQKLNNIIKNELLEPNELAIVGLDIYMEENGQLLVTLLLRNGTMDDLVIKQLPLKLYDAKDDLIAQGTFQFGKMEVLAHTTKPVILTFPATRIKKEKIDLTNWYLEHHS